VSDWEAGTASLSLPPRGFEARDGPPASFRRAVGPRSTLWCALDVANAPTWKSVDTGRYDPAPIDPRRCRMADYDRALYQLYLSRIPMFSTCTEDQLDLIAQLGDAVATEAGHDVVREGDTGEGFYVITSGSALVRRGDRDVATLGAGDYFGELSLFDPAPRNATVTAASSLSCVVMSRASFVRALNEVAAVRDALLHGMARRIHDLDQRI
jgi:CRP/FNR family cyclic AMP-dependent transcriptional regulator